jgi:hypothetical protein
MPRRKQKQAVRGQVAAIAPLLAALMLAALMLIAASRLSAAAQGGIGYVELQPATLQAFTRYQALTEARVAGELAPGGAFLYVDSLAPAAREEAYASLRQGKTRIEELHTLEHGAPIACPGGLIHHWLGIIFVPGATLERTLQLVEDYNRQAEIYAPEVVKSRVISHSGNDYKIFLRFKQQDVITVVLDTEHDVHYTRIDAQREASKSISTSIREVAAAGKPNEHDLAADTGGGYLWRINTYWRFLARDGGVYVQCESISLTRDIPTGLGWIVGPFVTSIPRDSLSFTLEAMKKALLAAK